ncbi:hypothetical protein [Actinoplanes sp. NPDC051494]|uniref:hypothetical protein n=1 Tax=Actinoplanes sp. NPDC051494 TaxID=3363907 RepID=UPI0037B31760
MMEPLTTGGTGERGHDGPRPLPEFFLNWRSGWGDAAASWTPTDYLNQDSAIAATVAAGWLFNPSTVRYRGAIFLAERFNAPNVDEWFERYPEESARVEAVVNTVALYDFFVNADTDPYENSLPGLAADVGVCWRGVLTLRYPDLDVHVETTDGSGSGEYGPSVTFWTRLKP